MSQRSRSEHLVEMGKDEFTLPGLEETMRKMLFAILTLALAAVTALTSAPKAEATTYCSWQCGECGLVCPCDVCRGPVPFCVCQ